MSICIDLNCNWLFIRRRMGRRWLAGDGSVDGCPADLPHCWNANEEFQEGVEYYRGWGSYRKVFRMPPCATGDDAAWLLESEGFYGTGELWLNGKRAAELDGQYLGFSIDVGANLRPGVDNVVALRLTNRCASHVLPGIKDPDFLLYGGLSGRMRLRQVPSLHVDQGSFRVFCRVATATDAEVVFACAVNNRAACDKQFAVKWIALDADGKCVAETGASDLTAMAGGRCENISGSIHIAAPRLWSPDSPYLYRVDCELLEQDQIVERQSTKLGVRRAEFKPGQGFFLNGMRMFLRGCNRHESMPGFGRALPVNAHREDAALIKSLGLNFVRFSHYPQHPEFLDACDELGIMACAELASWKSVRGGRWLRSACRQWHDMILRDRNHPSVIMWCMGNESRNRRAYLELRRIARELDPDRPVTYAENHLYRARREKTIGIPDVWGSNYELDVLEDGAAASALNCVVVTECSNYPNAVRGNAAEELRQVEVLETDLKRLEGRPCVAGFALWCFNDYATMRKKRYRRFSGIVDAWRSPKMSCALLRAMFLKEPFIRVFANWAKDPPASAHASVARRTIHVFTNCGKAVLKINGQPVANLSGGPHIATALEFMAGELSAEGSLAGKIVSDSIVSSGRPARVSAADAHVAHLNTGKEWGGGENQVFNLVRHLVEAGSRNTIFALQGGELFSRAAAAGLPVKPMPAGAWLSRFPPGYMRLAQACRESGVDIIHAHDSRALDAGIAVSRQLRIPLVYTRRVASPLRQNPFSRRKYSSRNISAVIAISETVKNVFLKSGYPAERVHVVPTAIDLDRLSETQADPDLRSTYNSDYLVGGLGKLSRKKNWQFLIRVAAFMKDRKPDIQWLIAGEGPERANLERLAKDAGVSSRVHLLGMRTDAASILKTLDILFSPSVAEGAGVTIREAMVLGTPVVAVDAPGSMESLAGHGWPVKDGDIEGAARTITEVLSDEPKRRAVCEEARASAISRFSFDSAVEGTLEVYRSVSKR